MASAADVDYRLSENSQPLRPCTQNFKDYGRGYEYILGTNDIQQAAGVSPIPEPQCAELYHRSPVIPTFRLPAYRAGANHVLSTTLNQLAVRSLSRSRMLNPIRREASPIHSCPLHWKPRATGPIWNISCTLKDLLLSRVCLRSCFSEAYNPANLQLQQIQDSAHGQAAQLNLEGTISVAKNYHIGSHTSTFRKTGFYPSQDAHKDSMTLTRLTGVP